MALTKVTRSGITDNSVNAAKIEDGTIVDADITPGTITNAKLAGSIANAKLANSSITINGAAIALGGSVSAGSIAWQSVVVSDGSTVTTMVAGRGYFVNNTSAAGIVKLPAGGTAGDTIAIKDYAGNFATNKLTIQRNGHNIQGVANDGLIGTNRASVVLVYIDATRGWLYTNESNVGDLQQATFIGATGGTVTTSGDYKIHSFTGDSNFVVGSLGNPSTPTTYRAKVDYLVIAGGGGGGSDGSDGLGGGGGAGGMRESDGKSGGCYTASPLKAACGALTVTAQTYPVTVGGGGTNCTSGSNSIFSTITSAGGGKGGIRNSGAAGGSGGGGAHENTGSAGNTPPVSPPQGNAGGNGVNSAPVYPAGGGGGSAEAGNTDGNGQGGDAVATHITGSPVEYSAGGGGAVQDGARKTGGGGGGGLGGDPSNPGVAGTANGGHGGGGGSSPGRAGGAGGKGIVIIRYKFQ